LRQSLTVRSAATVVPVLTVTDETTPPTMASMRSAPSRMTTTLFEFEFELGGGVGGW